MDEKDKTPEKPPAKGFVGRFWLGTLVLLGFACYGLTASINFFFASTMTITGIGTALMASQAGLIDGLALCFGGVGGGFWNVGRRKVAMAMWVLALGFMTVSVGNSIGFGAKERIGVVQVAAKKEHNANEAIREENRQAKAAHDAQLAALKKLYNEADNNKERSRLLTAMSKHASMPPVMKPEIVDEGATDYQADLLQRKFGVTASEVSEYMVMAAAILVVLGKLLGPAIGIANWPAEPMAIWGKIGRFFRREAKVEEAGDKPAAAPIANPTLATKQAIDLDRARDRALVKEWMDTAIVRVNRAQNERAETVYGWFREWCQKEKKLGSVMTGTRFGRLTADFDMPKEKKGAYVVYRGVARKGVAPVDISMKADIVGFRRKNAA